MVSAICVPELGVLAGQCRHVAPPRSCAPPALQPASRPSAIWKSPPVVCEVAPGVLSVSHREGALWSHGVQALMAALQPPNPHPPSVQNELSMQSGCHRRAHIPSCGGGNGLPVEACADCCLQLERPSLSPASFSRPHGAGGGGERLCRHNIQCTGRGGCPVSAPGPVLSALVPEVTSRRRVTFTFGLPRSEHKLVGVWAGATTMPPPSP